MGHHVRPHRHRHRPGLDAGVPPGAAAAAHRAARRRVTGGARADGRHHQPRLPAAVPRVRQRGARGRRRVGGDQPLRVRDGHHPGPRRAHARDDAAHLARPRREPAPVQLYGVDPVTVGQAARMLVTEDRADHIDLNFGCPVPKVTRKGGGAALPWKTDLFRGIVAAVVRAASPYDVPVTVKMRSRHRRRPRHLPRCRADRRGRGGRGRRAARPHRCPALLRAGRLVGDRPAQGGRHVDPGAGQRRHLVGRGRPRDGAADRLRRGRRRARLPRPAVAVRRPRRRVRRVRRPACSRGCAR